LLQRERRQKALAICSGLNSGLWRPRRFLPNDQPQPYAWLTKASLDNGCAGIALFTAYRHLILQREADRSRAISLLNRSLRITSEHESFPSLFEGFVGVAWTWQHLAQLGLVDQEAAQQGLAEVDEILERFLDPSYWPRNPWGPDFDLVLGLVGIGVYALDGLQRPSARRLVRSVILRLSERAEPVGTGVGWAFPRPHLRAAVASGHVPPAFELGVAHGCAGVVGFLARAVACGAGAEEPAPSLLSAASRFLASQVARFREKAEDPGDTPPAPPAWCRGLLGISLSLLAAARALGEAALERLAVDAALLEAMRRPNHLQGMSLGLCHGVAGAAHCFSRLYAASGHAAFRDAALAWFDALLTRCEQMSVGIRKKAPTWARADENPRALPPGLFLGAAGIGLAILAGVSEAPPCWDSILLAQLEEGKQ